METTTDIFRNAFWFDGAIPKAVRRARAYPRSNEVGIVIKTSAIQLTEELDKRVQRFHSLHLGDSLLHQLEIRTAEAQCILGFSRGSVLSHEGASITDPKFEFSPAVLIFMGTTSLSFCGHYELNSTVVDFEALPSAEDVEFSFDLTGGHSPQGFAAKLKIVGGDFLFGGPEQPEIAKILRARRL